jgi:hypothetical protein
MNEIEFKVVIEEDNEYSLFIDGRFYGTVDSIGELAGYIINNVLWKNEPVTETATARFCCGFIARDFVLHDADYTIRRAR